MRHLSDPLPHRDHRILIRTFNGHLLRSQGYTLDGCNYMVDRATMNPLISHIAVFGPGDSLVRQLSREHASAPLVEVPE